MKKFKAIIILILLLLLYIFISAYSYVSAISNNLYSSVFRLHVIANSDSEEDQNLKYIVRDNILNYINSHKQNFSKKEDTLNYAKEHIDELKKIAETTIYEHNFNYPISIEIGNFKFPTKKYNDITFPAGYYDALRIKIGESSGKNWWCVMFPPLCFINADSGIVPDESKKELQENLSQENYKIISENDTNLDISFKFKIIELFEKSGLITAKK